MRLGKLLHGVAVLLWAVLLCALPAQASSLSVSGVFLGQPDIFVPGVGLRGEILLTPSLGAFLGGAAFLSGTWDLSLGVAWRPSVSWAFYLQLALLFDVIDGVVPQVGTGLRWSFPLAQAFAFFNEVSVNVPLSARFLQPLYAVGFALSF